MSDNFRGVTFAEQAVTPADDAIVRRAILPDGILTGCEISYSGSTLTMAPGYIIACGRSFQHLTAQNWAVVEATSGYARLLLTIDLSKTATETSFNQIESRIEYASAEDGFMELVQDDINLSGIRYQLVAAVVSLGTGGITGIVSQLEKSRAEGGGANFNLVGGVTQPNDPKENMIWVNTADAVTGYVFAAEQPADLTEGLVWIKTGVSSGVAFNALKKNVLTVYPLQAMQVIGGSWQTVTAMSYQGGRWVSWWNGELYEAGNEFEFITGGWVGIAKGYSSDANAGAEPTITRGSTMLTMQQPGPNGGMVYTANKIDLTEYSTLVFDGIVTGATGYPSLCNFRVWSEIGAYSNINAVATETIQRNVDGEVTLDISGLSGEYYVGFGLWTNSPVVKMRSLKMV